MDKVFILMNFYIFISIKILEEEKLGLTRPPQQQHQRFDVPQQQTPHMGRGIRPFFRPRFQGPYHDQIGGQNFSQSQGPQAPQVFFKFIFFIFK